MLRKKGINRTAETRKAYQRRYYRVHKEKALEYQRLYNLAHKKKAKGKGKRNFIREREERQVSFSLSDVQHTPAEKLPKLIEDFNKDERMLTG